MMRFTVDARAFSDAMSKVSKVLRKNPIPILEEIAVCIQNGRCTLTATDLETWLVAELPARGDDSLTHFLILLYNRPNSPERQSFAFFE